MPRARTATVLAALALAAGGVAHAEPRTAQLARARLIYDALLSGQLQVSQLTPQQLRELTELDRQLRSDKRSISQRCVDAEVERASGRPSRLALRAIDMKCREPGER